MEPDTQSSWKSLYLLNFHLESHVLYVVIVPQLAPRNSFDLRPHCLISAEDNQFEFLAAYSLDSSKVGYNHYGTTRFGLVADDMLPMVKISSGRGFLY